MLSVMDSQNQLKKNKQSVDILKDKAEKLKKAKYHSLTYLPNILSNMFNALEVQNDNIKIGASIKDVTRLVNSKTYKELLQRVKKGAVVLEKKKDQQLYAGVCGVGNICAVTDMTHLLTSILTGHHLKWDQPHKFSQSARVGDLMGFIFGIGHPFTGQMIVLQIDQILTINDREPHWSDLGYTATSVKDSTERGCVLFKQEYTFGIWTASGVKIKQGFSRIVNNREEYVF